MSPYARELGCAWGIVVARVLVPAMRAVTRVGLRLLSRPEISYRDPLPKISVTTEIFLSQQRVRILYRDREFSVAKNIFLSQLRARILCCNREPKMGNSPFFLFFLHFQFFFLYFFKSYCLYKIYTDNKKFRKY